MTTTAEVIRQMLVADTGRHFLDSGGAYGRHWERNQGRDFEKEPRTVIEVDSQGDVTVTHNLYHFLNEHLDYDAGANHALKVLARWKRMKGEEMYGLQLANEFPEFYARYLVRQHWEAEDCETCDGVVESGGCESEGGCDAPGCSRRLGIDTRVPCDDCNGHGRTRRPRFEDIELDPCQQAAGIYGEGEPVTVNTYNGEDLLSQTIQYVYFTIDRGEFVVLRVHGGCDVRGGYTDPVVFIANGNTELGIFDNAKASIGCFNCSDRKDYWTTDDGYRWHYQGTCGASYTSKELRKLDVVWILATNDMELDEDREEMRLAWFKGEIDSLSKQTTLDGTPRELPLRRYVLETIDGERSLLCRHCGEKMSAGFY